MEDLYRKRYAYRESDLSKPLERGDLLNRERDAYAGKPMVNYQFESVTHPRKITVMDPTLLHNGDHPTNLPWNQRRDLFGSVLDVRITFMLYAHELDPRDHILTKPNSFTTPVPTESPETIEVPDPNRYIKDVLEYRISRKTGEVTITYSDDSTEVYGLDDLIEVVTF